MPAWPASPFVTSIRNLDDDVKTRLRIFAARQGRSMEDAAREILRTALANRRPPPNFVEALRHRFAAVGGVDLPIALREPSRALPKLKR